MRKKNFISLALVFIVACTSRTLIAQEKDPLPEATRRTYQTHFFRSADLYFIDAHTLLVLRYFAEQNEPVLTVYGFGEGRSVWARNLFGKAELEESDINAYGRVRSEGIRVSVAPGGNKFLTYSMKTVRLWEVRPVGVTAKTVKKLGKPLEHEGSVRAALTRDEKQILTMALVKKEKKKFEYQIRYWEADTGNPVGDPSTGTVEVRSADTSRMKALVFAPDEKTFVSAYGQNYGTGREGFLQFWDAKTFKPIGERLPSPAETAQFAGDGKTLLVLSAQGRADLWNVPERKKMLSLSMLSPTEDRRKAGKAPRSIVHTDGFSILGRKRPDKDSPVETVELWDLRSDPPVQKQVLKHAGQVNWLTVSPDGKLAATEGQKEEDGLRIWNLETGKAVSKVPSAKLGGPIRAMDFSPDGTHLATVTDSGVILWIMGK